MGYGAHAGITGFHKWFEEAFPTAVSDAANSRQRTESFDHVCIDMNSVSWEHTSHSSLCQAKTSKCRAAFGAFGGVLDDTYQE